MRKLICAIVCGIYFGFMPQSVQAMDTDFGVRFAHENDLLVGEIWYDHALLWQFSFAPTGAMPVSTNQAKYQTVITPEFTNGFFLFHMK